MKKFIISTLVFGASLTTVVPTMSQAQVVRLGNETAFEMATRINICGADSVLADAEFADSGNVLQATCVRPGALTGGLGAAAAVAGGVIVVAALAASGGSSSSTTTTAAAD